MSLLNVSRFIPGIGEHPSQKLRKRAGKRNFKYISLL